MYEILILVLVLLFFGLKRERYVYVCQQTRTKFIPELNGLYSINHEYYSLNFNGVLTMKPGYAYDGCTFKFILFGCIKIGVFDGYLNLKTNRRALEFSSGWHDILCQIKKPKIPRSLKDLVFKNIMIEDDFKLSNLYYNTVRFFAYMTFQWK